ncbi:MAG TPA: efflux RND transporter periplasmic adaptor subunit [Caulobacterales bacterium]|nr:efflux RND transporter periplasmic adaptor subunit [Caulobacterales bacterium]
MFGVFRRYGFAAVVTAALALMGAIVLGKSMLDGGAASGDAKAAPSGQAKGGAPTPSVSVAAVSQYVFADAIQALGTAQAKESIVITPKVADTIRALHFDSGARVRRGQVLVEMSSVEQTASLAEARAANEQAQQDLRRNQELFDRGFLSQARLDAVKAAADAAQARVDAGASRISDRTIAAPFSGVIGLRTASPGQYVSPGVQIGTLDDISQIKLDFDVPETQLARIASGVAITARTAAFPDENFTGAISQVDSRVNPTTRTVRVRALLPNPQETLRPGMLMTVDVRANQHQALAIPEIAILEEANASFVLRVNADNKVERVRIATGQRSDGMAEVTSGLNEGDQVIIEGLQAVRPGQSVRIQAAEGGAGGLRGSTR